MTGGRTETDSTTKTTAWRPALYALDGARTMRSPSTGTVEEISSALFHIGRPGYSPENTSPVGGLRMAQDPTFEHEPVMADQVVAVFASVPPGIVVDATVGGGGHAARLLEACPQIAVLGIDRDPDALAAAAARLRRFGDRVVLRHGRFDEIEAIVADEVAAGHLASVPPQVVGVLFDLGVSSPQLDRPERGFSYRSAGPLDMRMDPDSATTAADLVNGASVDELTALFAESGEGRFARRIATAIERARPLTTTTELADVVAAAIPAAARRRGHPARRVFQALRIAVNDELTQLEHALPAALALLGPQGRCAVIAYHSGEDRMVKASFRDAVTGGCVCPPGLPCVCGATPRFSLVFRGSLRPSPDEVARNHRAESARLRAVECVADEELDGDGDGDDPGVAA